MGTGALEVNAARTAVEIVVPPEQAVLLEITQPWAGVHDATRELLREVNHPYLNWAAMLGDLHRRATADLAYHDRHARGAEGIAILSGLYGRVAREAPTGDLRDEAVRLWLGYLLKLAGTGDGHLPLIEAGLADLGAILTAAPERAPGASPRLRRLARDLVQLGEPAAAARDRAFGLLALALERTYAHWSGQDDPIAWYRADAGLRAAPEPPEAVERIGRARMQARLDRVGALRVAGDGIGLLELPDAAQVERDYLAAAEVFGTTDTEETLAHVRWLFRLLDRDDLAAVHEAALREVARCVTGALDATDPAGQEAFVREAFALLDRHVARTPRTALQVVRRVGRAVLGRGEPELVDVLVDAVLSLDFAYPDFSGFSPAWEAQVNPAHLQNVRAYLDLIAADPVLARPLLAALVVHLRLGGLFVADTDLFQRDVSALLACDVRPVYVQVRHLLRLLPVFFNDIGAEGELRAVSTRLDELRHRGDGLCHFLRKQSHVECNPRLVTLVEESIRYLATGEPEPLRSWVPESLFAQLDATGTEHGEMHRVLHALAPDGDVGPVLALPPEELRARLAAVEADAVERERVELLVRLHRELVRKYALDDRDAVERLRAFRLVDQHVVDALEQALAAGDAPRALDAALTVLETLQAVVLSRETTEPVERIYQKRHIAVGIPSLYGSYREDRFEAMGLSFRVESLAGALLDRVVAADHVTADAAGMRRVADGVRLLLRALRIDGFKAQGVAQCLALLDDAVAAPDTTVAQFVDIVQLLSRSLHALIGARILDVYEEPAHRVIRRQIQRGIVTGAEDESLDHATMMESEAFLRDVIAESLGAQRLDALVGDVLAALREAQDSHAPARPGPLRATVDLARCLVPLEHATGPGGGIMRLGNKAYMLARLKALGFAVPDGFVLTTELFQAREALATYGLLREELADRIRRALVPLEQATGERFGDPASPLLLSVRGGAPISMPGMLTSFLNVGMNLAITEGLAARPGRDWAAWDAYRRFLQFWGMSHGLDRDGFDEIIRAAKQARGVPKKALLPASSMREVALAYRQRVLDHGIHLVEEPFAQLLACVDLVQRSWDAEHARIYRREARIAEEWGTAVIVQPMVFGNLGPSSGTGVLLTRHPQHGSDALHLFGDVVVQGQGDDVVSGIAEPFPVSERQRRDDPRGADRSLERDFPAIHAALARVARSLLQDHGMNHQEIEFTFESDRAEDLSILQTRDTVVASTSELPAFAPSLELERSRVAAGIGVSGGALSGRVALDAAGIERVRAESPDAPVILLRPDTVPDDLPLVLRCDGVLTALGGATSHAAVAAKRLGKTCVVGCRPFDVDERGGRARLGGHELAAGDLLSIDGIDGSVYLGAHSVTTIRIGGRSS